MKKFNVDAFIEDLSYIPMQICSIFDDPNDVLWSYTVMLNDVVETHAPLKKRILRNLPLFLQILIFEKQYTKSIFFGTNIKMVKLPGIYIGFKVI